MEIQTLSAIQMTGPVVPGCVSVDASTDDNGYLQCARNFNPNAGRHHSIDEAASNLAGDNTTKVLIGHGNTAMTITGTGLDSPDPSREISLWNQDDWKDDFVALNGRCSTLHLYSCHTGTGDDGATFLFNLARVVGCTVVAPTGFIYINPTNGAFSLELGSTWQSATPTQKPAPIDAPTPYPAQQLDTIILADNNQGLRMNTDDVLSVSYTPLSSDRDNGRALVDLDGDRAKSLVSRLAISEPFTLPGIPSVMITGRLKISMANGLLKSFLVLNNRLLQDEAAPLIFHYWNKDAPTVLLGFL